VEILEQPTASAKHGGETNEVCSFICISFRIFQLVPVTLKMWKTGFSMDDGELRPYEAPASREFMQQIMTGFVVLQFHYIYNVNFSRIPAELVRAYPGREIDLQMEDHRTEEYKAPPMKPFSGAGQRLGAVVPALSNEQVMTSSSSASAPGTF
jgi:UBX domain-containing protein 1